MSQMKNNIVMAFIFSLMTIAKKQCPILQPLSASQLVCSPLWHAFSSGLPWQLDGHIIQWGSASRVWLVYNTHPVDTDKWSYYTMGISLRCVAGIQHSPHGYKYMPQETRRVLDVYVVVTEYWVQDRGKNDKISVKYHKKYSNVFHSLALALQMNGYYFIRGIGDSINCFCQQAPLLSTWINFDPDMDK